MRQYNSGHIPNFIPYNVPTIEEYYTAQTNKAPYPAIRNKSGTELFNFDRDFHGFLFSMNLSLP